MWHIGEVFHGGLIDPGSVITDDILDNFSFLVEFCLYILSLDLRRWTILCQAFEQVYLLESIISGVIIRLLSFIDKFIMYGFHGIFLRP